MKARENRLPAEKRLQERMLLSLQCTKKEKRDLRVEPINQTILAALKSNDIHFFMKLGRVLSTKPFDETYQGPQASRLDEFLIDHWAQKRDGLPEFFRLSPDALAEVCARNLKRDQLSAHAVVKLRQRIGLKTTRGRKLQASWDGEKFSFR